MDGPCAGPDAVECRDCRIDRGGRFGQLKVRLRRVALSGDGTCLQDPQNQECARSDSPQPHSVPHPACPASTAAPPRSPVCEQNGQFCSAPQVGRSEAKPAIGRERSVRSSSQCVRSGNLITAAEGTWPEEHLRARACTQANSIFSACLQCDMERMGMHTNGAQRGSCRGPVYHARSVAVPQRRKSMMAGCDCRPRPFQPDFIRGGGDESGFGG